MGVLGECEKRVSTLLVMRAFSYFPGAPRGGTNFRDPAAVFRIMAGYAATREIKAIEERKNQPKTPILALTANAMSDDKAKCLKIGMDNYISKPIKKDQLKEVLIETCKKRINCRLFSIRMRRLINHSYRAMPFKLPLIALAITTLSFLTACSTVKHAKFEPKDDRIIVFAGQSVDATLDYYENLPNTPKPAGYSDYISYDIGSPYKPFAADAPRNYEGNDGLFTSTNWGSGNQCVACNLNKKGFEEAVLNIGFYMAGPQAPNGKMCHGTPECNTYKIAQGDYDGKLNELADWLISIGQRPVFLRIGYEFEGSWNGYEPEQYKAAYKHIVNLLDKRGVTNTTYVLHTAGNITREELEAFYPHGDDSRKNYVEWLGFSRFAGKGAVEIEYARENDLKIFLGEVAPHSGDCKDQINLKTDTQKSIEWIQDFFQQVEDNRDVIRGIAYINENWSDESYSPQWQDQSDQGCGGFFSKSNSRLNDNAEVEKVWAKYISSPRYLNWEKNLYKKLHK